MLEAAWELARPNRTPAEKELRRNLERIARAAGRILDPQPLKGVTMYQYWPDEAVSDTLECARGCYQNDLLWHNEAWSGATLTGLARRWGGRYAASRDALVERIDTAMRRYGWEATTALVLREGRWRRELVAQREDKWALWDGPDDVKGVRR